MQSLNNDIIIKKLSGIKPILKKRFGLKEMALFGSMARNDYQNSSDIDILIDLERNTSEDFFQIAFSLKDLFYPIKVDIVTLGGIKEPYFQAIKGDLIYV